LLSTVKKERKKNENDHVKPGEAKNKMKQFQKSWHEFEL